MNSARLLLAAWLLCSLYAFSQDPTASPAKDAKNTTSPAPGLIVPWNSPSPDPLLRLQEDPVRDADGGVNLRVFVNPDNQPVDDTTCYAIRSYVVARDSKDSDSTHPVGYSTCQPAKRYGLKRTENPAAKLVR